MNTVLKQALREGDNVTYLYTKGDPRVANWFLMQSYFPTFLLCLAYLYFVKFLGPAYMANRKPYKLRAAIILYNVFQIGMNVWLVFETIEAGVSDYSFVCQPLDVSNSPKALRMCRAFWSCFMLKIIDFLDTIFFVLRKKSNQASFLHVYHHLYVVNLGWISVKIMPGGHGALTMTLNCVVHAIMYLYYLLASLGPEVRKHLWWKKYLTGLQLFQFCISLVHTSLGTFISCSPEMRTIGYLYIPNLLLFFHLFASFYRNSYCKKEKNT